MSMLPGLPKDLWNHIVRLAYVVPQTRVWWTNYLEWFTLWMTRPVHQEYNPLLVTMYDTEISEWFSELSQRSSTIHINGQTAFVQVVPHTSWIRLSFEQPGQIMHRRRVNVDRLGDVFLGIVLTDELVESVVSISLCISGKPLRMPFDFRKHSWIGGRKVCYHPELPIVPLSLFSFQEVHLEMCVLDDKPIDSLSCMFGLVEPSMIATLFPSAVAFLFQSSVGTYCIAPSSRQGGRGYYLADGEEHVAPLKNGQRLPERIIAVE